MKAFVEVLSGIVRAGPEADEYGKPYDGAIAFACTDGKTAIIKALTADGSLTVGHVKAGVAELKKYGLTARWERIK